MKKTNLKKNEYIFGIFKLCYLIIILSALYVLRLQFITGDLYIHMLRASSTYEMCQYISISTIILTGGVVLFYKLGWFVQNDNSKELFKKIFTLFMNNFT